MPPPAVVVIGASAGGLEALTAIARELPASLPACVLVVMHSSTNGQAVLPQILQRNSALRVSFATTGDRIVPGHIYVARPDFHLIVSAAEVMVVHGPRENGFRPAIDPLFRTAGRELGPRAIGVILSGALSDGTYGLSVIKQRGGTAIVQDPEDAVIPSMPQSAIRYVEVDSVLPASEIAGEIVRLAQHIADSDEGLKMPHDTGVEPQQPAAPTEIADMQQLFGPPSALTCPDCGGALWQVQEDRVVRFQCHVGHQYAPENLEAAQRDEIDGALWSAVRVLEEHAELKTRLADRAAGGGMRLVSKTFSEGARDARKQADRIRSVLFSLGNGEGDARAARAEDRSDAKRRMKKGRMAKPDRTRAKRR